MQLPEKARADALAKLLVLSGLRKLQAVVSEEVQQLPITIDIMENPFLRDIFHQGEKKGGKQEAITLLRMLERKFGTLPEWAVWKLEAADLATLENWGLRLLAAGSLEEVLQ